jgi:adenylate cyclase
MARLAPETFLTDAGNAEWEHILMAGHPPMRIMRRVFRAIPSSPRCKMCNNPFGGLGGRAFRTMGFAPSRKNPNVCTRCFEKLPPGGAEIDVAVLFADVRGSTGIAAGESAADYAARLNRFYGVATDALLRNDAIVDKLIGDEVMALFVRGLAGREYRLRAVDAAVDLLRAVGYGTDAGPWLEVGAGVNAGVAWVGNVGGSVSDMTALGDPVNVAARLQEHARGGEVVVAADLAPDLAQRFPGATARAFPVRGRGTDLDGLVLQASATPAAVG